MKKLVAYFSATGFTKAVAERLAKAAGADLFEIKPTVPYTHADLDWTNKNSRSSVEMSNPDSRPEIGERLCSIEDYDTVFIGYPIWWGIAAWPVDGFISANDFTGKTVIPFCTSSSSGLGESGDLLFDAAGTGTWLEGERFSSGTSEETIQSWLEGLGL